MILNECPGCRLSWWLFPPVKIIGPEENYYRCVECKRVYEITVKEVKGGA